LFDKRELEISYDIFSKYFEEENNSSLFSKEDYSINDIANKKSITIKNCLLIPMLGIFRLLDDFKNGTLKQGWRFTPYATFTDPGNDKAYTEIKKDQIRAGE
jgi:hypothetical protein